MIIEVQKRMPHVKLLFAAVIYVVSGSVIASALDDEAKHFLISGACGAGCETILHYNTEMNAAGRISLATLVGCLPGLAKEIIDSGEEGNKFSGSDMAADIAGSFAGAFLSSKVNDRIEIRLKADRSMAMLVLFLKF